MNAVEYLERIKKLDVLIQGRLRDYKRWCDIAEGMGGVSTGDRVQSSRNLHRGQDAIIEYISIEEDFERLKDERMQIIRTIERLPIPEYSILCKIYVEDYTIKEIAHAYDRSYDWVKKKKRKAIAMIQEILNEDVV